MRNRQQIEKEKQIENNMIFVGTIYESFEALEETLGKLKLERPLFLVHVAKKAFAHEIFKYADDEDQIFAVQDQPKNTPERITLQ